MKKRADKKTELTKWERPVLTAIDMNMSNVGGGFDVGSDGVFLTGSSMS